MKETTKDCLQIGDKKNRRVLTLPVLFYESIEEAAKDAGQPTAPLDRLNSNLFTYGRYGEAQELIAEVTEKESKVKRLAKQSPADYVKTVLAKNPSLFDQVQVKATEAAKTKKFSVSMKGRSGREKSIKLGKLAQVWKDLATGFLTGRVDKVTRDGKEIEVKRVLSVAQESIKAELGRDFIPSEDKTKNIEELGWLLRRTDEAAKARAAVF